MGEWSYRTKTTPNRQLRPPIRRLTACPWLCQLIAPFPLSLGIGTAELLALPPAPFSLPPPSEVGVPVVSALIPPPPYGQPTKLVSGCMKHVNPDAVPLIKLVMLAICPTLLVPSVTGGEVGSSNVTLVRDELSDKSGVGMFGVR